MKVVLTLLVWLLAITAMLGQTAKRYITVEHFTNTRCSTCASGNPNLFTTLDNNPGEVHHLSIHSEVPYSTCIYYQYNTVGNNYRKDLYNITGTPTTLTNGTVRGVGGVNLLPQSRVDGLKNSTSPLRIQVQESISGNMLNIAVKVKSFADVSNTNLRMFVTIAEKETMYNAPNGEDEHFNVFRTMLPDNSGMPFTSGVEGQVVNQYFSVALDPAWQISEVYALVFIQDTVTKEVLNSGTKFDMILEYDITAADCATADNGSVELNVTGGTPPYTYAWSSGGTTATETDLSADAYTVTVTDAESFTYIDTVWVPISNSLATSLSYTSATPNNGTATVVTTGGIEPYTYLWSNGNTSATANSLSVGYATVTVTDDKGCTITDSIFVSSLTVQANVTDVTCYGNADGAIKLDLSGGTAPYTYSWSVPGPTDSVGGLAAGVYLVTVLDDLLNEYIGSFTVNEPDTFFTRLSGVLDGGPDDEGVIAALVSGGIEPYTYEWSTGENGSAILGIQPDILYKVTVTDANGCVDYDEITLVPTNVNELGTIDDVKICPNPFDSKLTIGSEALKLGGTIELYDLYGRKVRTLLVDGINTYELNTADLLPGIYLVMVPLANETLVKRLIKP